MERDTKLNRKRIYLNETPQQRTYRLAWEAKNLPVPATCDANPPTYGGLLAMCEILQLIGGHSSLWETMLTAIKDAEAKNAKQGS